jgi:AcrR family transcriptional regulator
MTARGKRGPYQKSRARKEQIARAVLEIVDEGGIESVTVAGVAESAGMPEPSVLYYFPTKDHLLVAALRLADEQTAAATGVDLDDIDLDVEALRAQGLGPQWRSPNRQRLDAAMRALSLNPDHPAHEVIAERNRHALTVWTRIVAHRQRDGLADQRLDPKIAAWQILAILEGFSTFTIAEPERWMAQDLEVGDLIADAVLRLTGTRT